MAKPTIRYGKETPTRLQFDSIAPTMLTATDIFRTGGGASRLHAICLNHGMTDDAIERLSIRRLIATVDRLLAADRAGE